MSALRSLLFLLFQMVVTPFYAAPDYHTPGPLGDEGLSSAA